MLRRSHYFHSEVPRSRWLMYAAIAGFIICTARLFQLEVLSYDAYANQAREKHSLGVEIPARRGQIYTKDYHTSDLSLLATNISLYLLYVDPTEIADAPAVVNALTPFIFDPETYRNDLCEANEECRKAKSEGAVIEILEKIKSMDPATLEKEFKTELLKKISQREVEYTSLATGVDQKTAQQISALRLGGIFVDTPKAEEKTVPKDQAADRAAAVQASTEVTKKSLKQQSQLRYNQKEFDLKEEVLSNIWANPVLVKNPAEAAIRLAPLIHEDVPKLTEALTRRDVRYVKLTNRIDPEVADKIRALNFRGVGLILEHWRYYPEGSLAAQILGFVNNEGIGQYGIEGSMNSVLEGKTGLIYAEADRMGRILPTSNTKIQQAQDGDDVVLTIDRSVQANVERMLAEQVRAVRADSGQVVIMNPQDGSIIALAEYPTFDPNKYGDVYERVQLYTKDPPKHTMTVFTDPADPEKRYVYKNEFGPLVYRLHSILDIYEPGSTFKSLVMAAGIDSGVITPNTPFNDAGPVVVDDYTIHNSEKRYYGHINMVDVLKYSLNTGMTFIAQSMGAPLLYEYITNFGFNARTDLEFEGEESGQLEYYRNWAPTELATKSFGQGIAVTLVQMATAYSAIANGGYLLQPHIIAERISADGTHEVYSREVIRRVVSEETSKMISAMLVTSVDSGVAKRSHIDGYLIAGKTGTSQIANRGVYEKGEGSTVGSFAGYAPADDTKFVILIKFDRPRSTEWGEGSAGPLFRKITQFLLDYYGIPPQLD